MDSRIETYKHIQLVHRYLNNIIVQLLARSAEHDQPKLYSPEVEIFDEITDRLANSTYMSEEYKGFLKELKPALDHHYANSRHHPEHFYEFSPAYEEELKEELELLKYMLDFDKDEDMDKLNFIKSHFYKTTFRRMISRFEKLLNESTSRINNMNLLDIIEMTADWVSSVKRHVDGNIYTSIEKNQERFGYSDQIKNILINTVDIIGNGKV
jgi:hypothetical protein